LYGKGDGFGVDKNPVLVGNPVLLIKYSYLSSSLP